ncbi:MAG TPA: hypothetical protein VNA15_07455 [Candidatus Angelobacter sp.]|nr:hypothetical protein [Candidatus Angelobacter sp.]
MKIEKLFSAESHVPFSLLFTSLALLLLALKLPGFSQNPGLLLIVTAIYGMVTLYTSIALNRKRWLIAPIIGVALTFVSALYSTTVYPVIPCGTIQISQGFPYAWIQRLGLSSESRCPLYFETIGGALPEFGFIPRTKIAYTGFITDALFYTLLTLAILELVAAARPFRSTSIAGFKTTQASPTTPAHSDSRGPGTSASLDIQSRAGHTIISKETLIGTV